MPPVRFLAGERVYLRPVEETDVPQFHAWVNDPALRPFMLFFRPMDLEMERAWWRGLDRSGTPSRINLAIVRTEDDALIGSTGLERIDWLHRRATSGSFIGPAELWGQGYGGEAKALLIAWAFDTLGLHRLESEVIAFNARSAGHLLKNGYVEEGRRRSAIFKNGQYWDEVLYGLLAEDWRASRRSV